MTPEPQETRAAADPRRGDRRGGDRRAVERRAPPPPWRRPWAYVAYGVGGALALVLLLRGVFGGDDPEAPPEGPIVARTQPGAVVPPTERPSAAPEPAYGAEDFERLVLEGAAAAGKRVRAELYCEAPDNVAVTRGEGTEAAVAALVDAQGRVSAATCKWGRRDDPRRQDFLLLVPPALAGAFASTPLTNDNFVRRRRLVADVEWVGRSPSLSLRTAGVLRGISRS